MVWRKLNLSVLSVAFMFATVTRSLSAEGRKNVADMSQEELDAYLHPEKKTSTSPPDTTKAPKARQIAALVAEVKQFRTASASQSRRDLFDLLRALGPVDGDVVPVLIEALNDSDFSEGVTCAQVCNGDPCASTCHEILLATLGKGSMPPDASAYLIKGVQDNYQHPWDRLIVGLGVIGRAAKNAVPSLIKILSNQNELRRCLAADALGKIGVASKAVVSSLAKSAQAGDGCAIEALGELGPSAKEAVPVLVEALKGGDAYYASKALAKIGTPSAMKHVTAQKAKSAALAAASQKTADVAAARAAKRERERSENWLKSEPWSAGEVLKVAINCMAAERKVRESEAHARDTVRRTGTAPPQELIERHEALVREGGEKCVKLGADYNAYLNHFRDEAPTSLWKHCDKKYGSQACYSLRGWLHNHR